jgi:hypothetical protein
VGGYDPPTYGLRNQDYPVISSGSTRGDATNSTASTDPIAPTRIDAIDADRIAAELLTAGARWLSTKDRPELRRRLLAVLLALDT